MRSRVLFLVGLLTLAACASEDPPPAPDAGEAGPAEAASDQAPRTPEEFLDAGRGKVVVLLLGMDGCAKTGAATAALARMAESLPDDVALARLDVPPPRGAVDALQGWSHPYFYAVDEDREIADRLDFFYYPTLYVLDRDGETRYAGGCEPDALGAMIAEIRAETPGGEKRVYTRPLPPVGSKAPALDATDLAGDPVDLSALAAKGPVVLLFTSIGCPFSREAADGLPDLAWELEDHDLSYVTIEKRGPRAAVRSFYRDLEMPGPVVHDADGSFCESFGVEPVPFFFVLAKDGTIAARGPYTPAAVRRTLYGVLGLDDEAAAEEPETGAG